MSYNNILLGAHVCHDKKTAPEHAKKIGANFIQMFLKNPKGYTTGTPKQEDLSIIKKQLQKHKIGCVVHSPYIINLARNPDQYQHSKGVDTIADDMNCCLKIGAIGAVIHMGKNVKSEKMTREKAFQNYVTGVESILKKSDSKSTLILETGAGCGTEICTKLDELGSIRKAVNKKYRKRIKFCIDTCHVFSAGYPINDVKYLPKFEKLIESHLGWKNVAVIHLNDSKTKLGSRVDRHQNIGTGFIGLKPLVMFVDICAKHNVPMVLETPVYNGENKFTHGDQIKLIKNKLKEYFESDSEDKDDEKLDEKVNDKKEENKKEEKDKGSDKKKVKKVKKVVKARVNDN